MTEMRVRPASRHAVAHLAMLFDIGWAELLLVGIVALVVIGPKDLPRAMRVAGFWMRKARTLSREFQSSVDQMIRESELEEIRQDMKKATEFDLAKEVQNTVDPTGSLAESIKPPEVPDYFDQAPGAAEPAATQATPALSAPVETALPEPAASVESTLEPARAAEATLEQSARPPGPPPHPIGEHHPSDVRAVDFETLLHEGLFQVARSRERHRKGEDCF